MSEPTLNVEEAKAALARAEQREADAQLQTLKHLPLHLTVWDADTGLSYHANIILNADHTWDYANAE